MSDDTMPREPEIFDEVREALTRDLIDVQARCPTSDDIVYVPPPGPSDEPYPDTRPAHSGRLVLTQPGPEISAEARGHGFSQGEIWRFHGRDSPQGEVSRLPDEDLFPDDLSSPHSSSQGERRSVPRVLNLKEEPVGHHRPLQLARCQTHLQRNMPHRRPNRVPNFVVT